MNNTLKDIKIQFQQLLKDKQFVINKTNVKTIEIMKTVTSKYFYKVGCGLWPGWQNGYFAKSVGSKSISKVKKYLANQ